MVIARCLANPSESSLTLPWPSRVKSGAWSLLIASVAVPPIGFPLFCLILSSQPASERPWEKMMKRWPGMRYWSLSTAPGSVSPPVEHVVYRFIQRGVLKVGLNRPAKVKARPSLPERLGYKAQPWTAFYRPHATMVTVWPTQNLKAKWHWQYRWPISSHWNTEMNQNRYRTPLHHIYARYPISEGISHTPISMHYS